MTLGFIVVLIILGVVLEAVKTKIGIDSTILWVVRCIIILVFCLALLQFFGVDFGTPVLGRR